MEKMGGYKTFVTDRTKWKASQEVKIHIIITSLGIYDM